MRIRLLNLPFVLLACGPDTGDSRADTGVMTAGTTTAASADTTATSVPPTTSPASSDDDGDATAVDPVTGGSTSTTTTGDATTTAVATTGPDDTTTTGMKLDLPPEMPIPVSEIPGLASITFYETTGVVTEYTFLVDGPELNTLLADPLSTDNKDIQGTSVEFYDVYYSDVDGNFDMFGSYLTIAGSFGAKLPAGGGLNLAEISLNSAIIA